jgi:hypothetical protein
MKTFRYQLVLFLFYLGVAGLTFFMYSLGWEQYVSLWGDGSYSDMEEIDLSNFGDNGTSTQELKYFLAHDLEAQALLRESTERLAPLVLNQLRTASKRCSSDFADLDLLLAGSSPARIQKFIDYLLGLAAPVTTEERLNTEVVRYSFFPKQVKALPDSQQQIGCMTFDLIEPENESAEYIVSIKGVSSFLIHSRACEEGRTPSL